MESFASMSRLSVGVVGSLLSLALVATGCGGGSSSPAASHPPTSTTARPSIRLMAERVTVTPRTSLQDGQQVTVSVKGFLPTAKFYLSECQTPTQANRLGCGEQLAAQPFGLTDENGQGSVSFTVQSSAATQPLTADSVPCSGECVIVATSGANGAFGFAPIAFAG